MLNGSSSYGPSITHRNGKLKYRIVKLVLHPYRVNFSDYLLLSSRAASLGIKGNALILVIASRIQLG